MGRRAVFYDINDTIKTRFDDNQDSRLSGRLTWLTFYDEPSNGRHLIHTGLGILHTDDHDDSVRFRARPQVQRGPVLIDNGNLAADSYTTGNVELAIVWGRGTLQNEAFLSNVDLLSGESRQVGGAYSHLSYSLTGENRMFEPFGQHGAPFGRNTPFTSFFATPGGGGWGAWEAKARWSHLDLCDVDGGRYNDLLSKICFLLKFYVQKLISIFHVSLNYFITYDGKDQGKRWSGFGRKDKTSVSIGNGAYHFIFDSNIYTN